MKTFAPVLAAGLFLSFNAFAAGKTTGTIPVKDADPAPSALMRDATVSYTYADLGYSFAKYDGGDGKTLTLGGSYLFMPSIFAFGGYSTGTLDGDTGGSADITSLNIGAGYRYPLSMTIDAVGTLAFVQGKVDVGVADDSDSGYRVGVGLRGALFDKIEGAGTVSYTDVFDEASTTFELSGLYDLSQFVPKLQAGLAVSFGDDILVPDTATSYGLKVRYSF